MRVCPSCTLRGCILYAAYCILHTKLYTRHHPLPSPLVMIYFMLTGLRNRTFVFQFAHMLMQLDNYLLILVIKAES